MLNIFTRHIVFDPRDSFHGIFPMNLPRSNTQGSLPARLTPPYRAHLALFLTKMIWQKLYAGTFSNSSARTDFNPLRPNSPNSNPSFMVNIKDSTAERSRRAFR